MTSAQLKALAGSFGRVLLATLTTAVAVVWASTANHDLLSWSVADVKAFASAVLGASVVTIINYVRKGDTRFGVGAQPEL
jgi:hypothetical protein